MPRGRSRTSPRSAPRTRSVHRGRLDLRRCRSRRTGKLPGGKEWVRGDELGSPRSTRTNRPPTMTGEPVTSIDFFLAEHELLKTCVEQAPSKRLRFAACRGINPNRYHPEAGSPRSADLRRCLSCPVRLECAALALRNEDPEERAGWYGGLSPTDRAALANRLEPSDSQDDAQNDMTRRARELRESGWRVNEIASELGCSRRTVQRHLSQAA